MYKQFELPVNYDGEELLFPAVLQQVGYTHCFVVRVYEAEVLFEPDKEGTEAYNKPAGYSRLINA